MNNVFNHRVNGFTLAEVIVTLALTSMAITFAYGTLTYVQKLFFSYKDQNRFMQEFTAFKQRMDHEALYSDYMMEQTEDHFAISRDSTHIELELKKDLVLMRKNGICDTFHFIAVHVKKHFELMPNSPLNNKLVKCLSFEVEYSKQKFKFVFSKMYDASVKLKLEKMPWPV